MAATAEPPVTARLRAFHRRGLRVIAKCQGEYRVPYGSGDELTKKLGGHSPSYYSCARKFAQLYPMGEQLNWICGLGRTKGKPLGQSKRKRLGQSKSKPLGPSHIIQLISVKKKSERTRLAKSCASQGWSVVRLRHEMAKTRLKKTFGGRQIRVAADDKLAIVELQFLTERWVRWIAASRTTEDRDGNSVYDRLPEQLRKALDDVNTIVEDLNETGIWASILPKKRTTPNTPRRGKKAPTSGRARGRAKSKKRT